jgi:GSH-dependent disulfide-bond oxidoreductase
MIDLYVWSTPNSMKVSIMLEECGLQYRIHSVDITTNAEQFAADYLKINPNGKVPSIVDSDGPNGKPIAMMESGAILIYLAEKTGRFFDQRDRYLVLQWLMFQMGGVGPSFGQAHHFMRAKKDEIPYGTERYGTEARRLYGVMDRRLGESHYFAGSYSIADMAIYPWVWRHTWHRVDLAEFPNVKRWYHEIGARPAVVEGMAVLEPDRIRALAAQKAATAVS